MNKIQITSLSLSVVALVLAIFTFLKGGGVGKGMDSYDFSTPEEALKSEVEIDLNGDILAKIEYGKLRNMKLSKERAESMKVHSSEQYDGKTILFVSYERQGEKRYDVESFEKDSDTGLWVSTYVSTYDMPDESEMKKKIREWERKGDK